MVIQLLNTFCTAKVLIRKFIERKPFVPVESSLLLSMERFTLDQYGSFYKLYL